MTIPEWLAYALVFDGIGALPERKCKRLGLGLVGIQFCGIVAV